MVSEDSLRILQNNADDVRKRLTDIQASLGLRPADAGQNVGTGTPEDVKMAVYNLTHIMLELAVAVSKLQMAAEDTLGRD